MCVRVCVRERERVCACVQGVKDGQLQSSLDPALLQDAHYRRVSSPQYIMFRKELLFHSHEKFLLAPFSLFTLTIKATNVEPCSIFVSHYINLLL